MDEHQQERKNMNKKNKQKNASHIFLFASLNKACTQIMCTNIQPGERDGQHMAMMYGFDVYTDICRPKDNVEAVRIIVNGMHSFDLPLNPTASEFPSNDQLRNYEPRDISGLFVGI